MLFADNILGTFVAKLFDDLSASPIKVVMMPQPAKSTGPAADLPSAGSQSPVHNTADSNRARERLDIHLRDKQTLRASRFTMLAVLAASLALAACATGTPSGESAAPTVASAPSGGSQRELTPDEKKLIVAAVAPSLRDPSSAKYKWTKLSTQPAEDGSINYCSTVDAKSPYAAYDGKQAYIVEVKMAFGKVTSAIMGLITGGKDISIVAKMCAKYGLDPNGGT